MLGEKTSASCWGSDPTSPSGAQKKNPNFPRINPDDDDDFKGFTCVSGALQAGEGGGEAGPVLRAGPQAPHVSQNLPVTRLPGLVHAELGLRGLGDEIRTAG